MNESTPQNSNQSSFLYDIGQKITYIDLVGQNAELLIGSEKRNKTFLGGSLTFLIFLLIFLAFLYFGQEIIFKQIPSVVLSSLIDDGLQPIVIDIDNFNFFFALKNAQNDFIDINSDFIDININIIKHNKKNYTLGNENSYEIINSQKIKNDYIDCNLLYKNNSTINDNRDQKNDKRIIFQQLVNNLNKSNYKCLNEKAEIYGGSETNEMSYLEINLNSCLDLFEFLSDITKKDIKIIAENVFDNLQLITQKNNISKEINSFKLNNKELKNIFNINDKDGYFDSVINNRKICPFINLKENIEQIFDEKSDYKKKKNIINSSIFIFKYIETYFDVRSFSQLANYVMEEYKSNINNNLFKNIEFNLKKIEYFTDKGLILEDFEITSYSQLLKITEFSDNKISNIENTNKYLNPLFNFKIKSNKIKDIYYRKYYKIQNLIAELGGLMKSFFIIAYILNYFNNNAKYYEKMIDELFDVDDLYKYYQYYNSKNKIIFKKYRDSILLRNTKNIDNFKKTIINKNSQNSRNFMKTKVDYSKEMLDGSLRNLEIVID